MLCTVPLTFQAAASSLQRADVVQKLVHVKATFVWTIDDVSSFVCLFLGGDVRAWVQDWGWRGRHLHGLRHRHLWHLALTWPGPRPWRQTRSVLPHVLHARVRHKGCIGCMRHHHHHKHTHAHQKKTNLMDTKILLSFAVAAGATTSASSPPPPPPPPPLPYLFLLLLLPPLLLLHLRRRPPLLLLLFLFLLIRMNTSSPAVRMLMFHHPRISV